VSRLRVGPDNILMGVSAKTPADAPMNAGLQAQATVASMYAFSTGVGTVEFDTATTYAQLHLYDAGGTPRFEMFMNDSGYNLEVRDSIYRNGGFLWLGRGESGNTYFGKHIESGTDSWIQFGASNRVVLQGAFSNFTTISTTQAIWCANVAVSAVDTQTIGWGATVVGTMNVQLDVVDSAGVNASSISSTSATGVVTFSTFGRSRTLSLVCFRMT
jgi:hypothetical protein